MFCFDAAHVLHTDFKHYRAAKTVNTIPYSKEIPHTGAETVPLGNFNSKKVTVVGLGQVIIHMCFVTESHGFEIKMQCNNSHTHFSRYLNT